MLLPLLVTLAFTAGDGLPKSDPASVGMSAKRLLAIDRVVARGISAGGYPGAVVVVGRKGAAVVQKGYGRLSWEPNAPRVRADETIYDLASLTKVVGTTIAIMILWDELRVELDAPVSRYLPAFSGGLKDSITIRHLLTHHSGLAASRDLWRVAHNPQEARLAIVDAPLQCRPGACFIYSDLGMSLLGMVVETASGQSLDRFLDERVFRPLGMASTFFRPADSLRDQIAPTAVAPPRGYPLQGEVHDENAYALGGVAGHAGLFSTASDIAIFAEMMLNGGEFSGVRVVSDSAIALFTHRSAGSRALGWDMADGDGGAGEYLSARAYGHTGFTGTSLWIDPERDLFVVLLTNRVHAPRARRPAKVISDVRADLADLASLAVVEDPDNILAMPARFRADKAAGWNRPERVYRSRYARGVRRVRSRTTTVSIKKPSKARSSPKVSSARKMSSSSNLTVRPTSTRKPAVASTPTKATAKSSARRSTVRPKRG